MPLRTPPTEDHIEALPPFPPLNSSAPSFSSSLQHQADDEPALGTSIHSIEMEGRSQTVVILTDEVISIPDSHDQITSTPEHNAVAQPNVDALDPTNQEPKNFHSTSPAAINQITARGIASSCLFIMIFIFSVYVELNLNILPSGIKIDDDGNEYSVHIEGKDALFLCLGPSFLMFLTYFLQKQSLFHDVPRKHVVLIILHQFIAMTRDLFRLWSMWRTGILLRSVLNVIPITFLIVVEKFIFRKELFKADHLGISLIVFGFFIFSLIALVTGFTMEYIEGFLYHLIACVTGTMANLIAEYVCKIDYLDEMNKRFGSKRDHTDSSNAALTDGLEVNVRKHMVEGHESSMNPAFWIGINGLIAFPLNILLILCSISFHLDGIMEFCSKLMSGEHVIELFIMSVILMFGRVYIITEITIQVSAVAVQLLIIAMSIPVFMINVFVNPMESMEFNVWNVCSMAVALPASTIGLLVYYEIVGRKQWQRRGV